MGRRPAKRLRGQSGGHRAVTIIPNFAARSKHAPGSTLFSSPYPKMGVSLLRRMAYVLLTGLALAISGCGGDGGGDQASGGHGGGGRGPGGPGGKPDQPPVPVSVVEASTGTISSFYSATATLEADKQAEILARVSGTVLGIDREEGDFVREGDRLLRIQDEEYALRLAQARARLVSQQARYDRSQGLANQDLLSAEEFEAVRNDYESAVAEEGLARLNLSYTQVPAPFSGRITVRHVDPGQNVSSGTPLFSLADFDPLLARVHVPSKEFKRLTVDQPVRLVLDSDQTRLTGRIKLVSPVIDPTSGTIKVTVEIPEYPAGTRPGDFAEVRIETERHVDVVLVPKVSVINDRGEQVVYVAMADSTAERRIVDLGFQDDQHAEIVNGITAGDAVVVRGQRTLKHGSPIKIMEDTLPGEDGKEERAENAN